MQNPARNSHVIQWSCIAEKRPPFGRLNSMNTTGARGISRMRSGTPIVPGDVHFKSWPPLTRASSLHFFSTLVSSTGSTQQQTDEHLDANDEDDQLDHVHFVYLRCCQPVAITGSPSAHAGS